MNAAAAAFWGRRRLLATGRRGAGHGVPAVEPGPWPGHGLGASTLISAVSYELVPQAARAGWQAALGLGGGAVTFFVGDWLVARGGGTDRKRLHNKPSAGSTGMAIFLGTLWTGSPSR
jgi:hypothetical protein